jgi:flagellar hook-length control protein FliK
MNESTIDNLLAAVPPVSDAASAAGSRTRDDSREFGDRLRQAAAPPAEPWWRAAPNRTEPDRGAPANSPPPSPAPLHPRRAPRPATDHSQPAATNSTKSSDRSSSRDDDPPARTADQSSADSVAAAAAPTVAAKPKPDKPQADDKPTTEPLQAAKSDAADTPKDKATIAASLTLPGNDSPPAKDASTTVEAVSATTTSDAAAAPQWLAATVQQSTATPATSNAATDNSKAEPPVDPTAAKSAPANVAAIPNDQATVATLKEAAPSNVTDPVPVIDAPAAKKTDAKATSSQKQTGKPNEQVSLSPVERLAAVQANSDGAQPNTAAVVATQNNDQKPSAKKDPATTGDKTAAQQPQQTAPIAIDGNQPVPVVAAVAATVPVAQAAVNNGPADSAQKVTKPAGPPNGSTLAAFGRIDRGNGSLTVSGPRQAGDGADMPTIDPARFISRVAKAIETAQDRGGPLNLRLSPPELGSMRIQLDVKQGVMTAKVETDTAVARQALLDNLPTLRARLAEHNVRIDRFDVDVRRDGTGDQASPGKQHQQYQQQYNQTPAARTTSAAASAGESAAADPAPLDRIITNTTINLVA